MKFKCGLTPEEKEKRALLHQLAITAETNRLLNWHSKFAWLPKHFPNGYCVWLGTYKRRYSPSISWGPLNRENSYEMTRASEHVRRTVEDLWSGSAKRIRHAERELAIESYWECAE